MKGRFYFVLLAFIFFTACVPQKKYEDMQRSYNDAIKRNGDCNKKYNKMLDDIIATAKKLKSETDTRKSLEQDTALLKHTNRELSANYGELNSVKAKLLSDMRDLEARDSVHKQELNGQLSESNRKLDEKEADLRKKQADIDAENADLGALKLKLAGTQNDLNEREKKVHDLEKVLSQKDSAVNAIKNSVANALLSYKDKGLSVTVKNGKVYLSVEEKLLFESGKYQVNPVGRQALLQVASALNNQPDVDIMVEGHTDSVPYRGVGTIKDNWDLSVFRATDVGRILMVDGGVSPSRVVVAGRGDNEPVASNATPEGRAKNRRTEIILTPKLSELYKVLGQ